MQVFGKVQGVCYRAFASKKGARLGLAGFVKNLPDGSVYMEAEGEEAALRSFEDWAHKGPPSARVDRVELNYSDRLSNFEDFEIRYW